jgi:hypothetical protein
MLPNVTCVERESENGTENAPKLPAPQGVTAMTLKRRENASHKQNRLGARCLISVFVNASTWGSPSIARQKPSAIAHIERYGSDRAFQRNVTLVTATPTVIRDKGLARSYTCGDIPRQSSQEHSQQAIERRLRLFP